MITKGLNTGIIKDGANGSMVRRQNMGRVTLMSRVNPINPSTIRQGGQRNIYFTTSADWKLLKEDEKKQWNEKARTSTGFPDNVPFKIAGNGIELFKQVNNFYCDMQGFGIRVPPSMGYQETNITMTVQTTPSSGKIDAIIRVYPSLPGLVFRVEMAVIEPGNVNAWYNQTRLFGYITSPPGVFFEIEGMLIKFYGKKPIRGARIYTRVYGIQWNTFMRTNETISISTI